jgi:hypothetical protein
MSATAKHKSSGANPNTRQEAVPAKKIVAVDRSAFAGLFRQFAARAQRAADESAAVARLLAHAADKLELPPAVTKGATK